MNFTMALGDQIINYDNLSGDMENYLINNYKDALLKGDKWAAKSYLLTARYFSINDQDVTNEIYLMAKADGDAIEASKCFAKIFNDIFILNDSENSTTKTNDKVRQVMEQMKEEIKLILGDLETKFMKLKSSAAIHSEVSQSNNQTTTTSPITAGLTVASPKPRKRMISVESRDSISKSDNQIMSYQRSVRKSFYQQLFENLPEDIRRNVLNHSIESCDNLLAACKLMMLTISIYNDSVSTYGSRLLRSLIDLSDTKKIQDGANLSSETCRHAKSLLVLDAIPLVLNLISLTNLNIVPEELFAKTLNFYSENYLDSAAKEYQVNELHEGMKKSITARILGIEHKPIFEELREDYLLGTLRFLSQKFMDTVTDVSIRSKFDELRCLIADKGDLDGKFEKINTIIQNLNFEIDLPDDVLYNTIKSDNVTATLATQAQEVITPPPKSRGRPKKNQPQQQSVIVSLDDGVKKHLHNKSREIQFVFHLIIEYMYVNCARYLKNTKSRILFKHNNDLLNVFSDTTKNSEAVSSATTQKTTRLKNNPQPTSETVNSSPSTSPNKKIKVDTKIRKLLTLTSDSHDSPLNSEQAKKMDKQVLATLTQALKCIEFLQNPANDVFNRLWKNHCRTNQMDNLNWYKRIQVDSLFLSSKYDEISDILNNELLNELSITDDTVITQTEQSDSQSCSVTTISSSSSSSNISRLRKLIQLTSCYVQLGQKSETYEKINDLLTLMKQSGLLVNDICPYENILDEYAIQIDCGKTKNLVFLLFDSMSIIRYCIDILTSIHKIYTYKTTTTTDTTIGHAIVLSQFDWPKESRLYSHCISWIRAHKPKSTTPQTLSATTKYTYPEFFSYIRNPNIIEDFMSLLNKGYTLDIKGPTTGCPGTGSQNSTRSNTGSTTTRASKMITTRGVNKSFKEDLKVALVSQMKSSSIIIPLDLIGEFLQDTFIPYLNTI